MVRLSQSTPSARPHSIDPHRRIRWRQNDDRNSEANPQEAIAASIARGMKTCRRRKPLDAGMIGRQGVFQIKNGPKRTVLENLKLSARSRRTT
jgi:hypothetical protein